MKIEGFEVPDFPMEEAIRDSEYISQFPEDMAKADKIRYEDFIKKIINILGPWYTKDELQKALDRIAGEWMDRYRELIHFRAQVASPHVVGPSNFPAKTQEKKRESYMKREEDLANFEDKMINLAKKLAEQKEIESKGGEIAVIKKDIEEYKKQLEVMKEANKIIRNKNITEEEKKKLLKDLGVCPCKFEEILKPDYMGRVGFKDYELGRIRDKIKRLEEKLKKLEEKESKKGDVEVSADYMDSYGFEIVKDYDDDRVQIYFKDIPPADLREKLKSRGFKWSPSRGAWVRKLTQNAVDTAREILFEYYGIHRQSMEKLEESSNEFIKARKTDEELRKIEEEVNSFYNELRKRYQEIKGTDNFCEEYLKLYDYAMKRIKELTDKIKGLDVMEEIKYKLAAVPEDINDILSNKKVMMCEAEILDRARKGWYTEPEKYSITMEDINNIRFYLNNTLWMINEYPGWKVISVGKTSNEEVEIERGGEKITVRLPNRIYVKFVYEMQRAIMDYDRKGKIGQIIAIVKKYKDVFPSSFVKELINYLSKGLIFFVSCSKKMMTYMCEAHFEDKNKNIVLLDNMSPTDVENTINMGELQGIPIHSLNIGGYDLKSITKILLHMPERESLKERGFHLYSFGVITSAEKTGISAVYKAKGDTYIIKCMKEVNGPGSCVLEYRDKIIYMSRNPSNFIKLFPDVVILLAEEDRNFMSYLVEMTTKGKTELNDKDIMQYFQEYSGAPKKAGEIKCKEGEIFIEEYKECAVRMSNSSDYYIGPLTGNIYDIEGYVVGGEINQNDLKAGDVIIDETGGKYCVVDVQREGNPFYWVVVLMDENGKELKMTMGHVRKHYRVLYDENCSVQESPEVEQAQENQTVDEGNDIYFRVNTYELYKLLNYASMIDDNIELEVAGDRLSTQVINPSHTEVIILNIRLLNVRGEGKFCVDAEVLQTKAKTMMDYVGKDGFIEVNVKSGESNAIIFEGSRGVGNLRLTTGLISCDKVIKENIHINPKYSLQISDSSTHELIESVINAKPNSVLAFKGGYLYVAEQYSGDEYISIYKHAIPVDTEFIVPIDDNVKNIFKKIKSSGASATLYIQDKYPIKINYMDEGIDVTYIHVPLLTDFEIIEKKKIGSFRMDRSAATFLKNMSGDAHISIGTTSYIYFLYPTSATAAIYRFVPDMVDYRDDRIIIVEDDIKLKINKKDNYVTAEIYSVISPSGTEGYLMVLSSGGEKTTVSVHLSKQEEERYGLKLLQTLEDKVGPYTGMIRNYVSYKTLLRSGRKTCEPACGFVAFDKKLYAITEVHKLLGKGAGRYVATKLTIGESVRNAVWFGQLNEVVSSLRCLDMSATKFKGVRLYFDEMAVLKAETTDNSGNLLVIYSAPHEITEDIEDVLEYVGLPHPSPGKAIPVNREEKPKEVKIEKKPEEKKPSFKDWVNTLVNWAKDEMVKRGYSPGQALKEVESLRNIIIGLAEDLDSGRVTYEYAIKNLEAYLPPPRTAKVSKPTEIKEEQPKEEKPKQSKAAVISELVWDYKNYLKNIGYYGDFLDNEIKTAMYDIEGLAEDVVEGRISLKEAKERVHAIAPPPMQSRHVPIKVEEVREKKIHIAPKEKKPYRTKTEGKVYVSIKDNWYDIITEGLIDLLKRTGEYDRYTIDMYVKVLYDTLRFRTPHSVREWFITKCPEARLIIEALIKYGMNSNRFAEVLNTAYELHKSSIESHGVRLPPFKQFYEDFKDFLINYEL